MEDFDSVEGSKEGSDKFGSVGHDHTCSVSYSMSAGTFELAKSADSDDCYSATSKGIAPLGEVVPGTSPKTAASDVGANKDSSISKGATMTQPGSFASVESTAHALLKNRSDDSGETSCVSASAPSGAPPTKDAGGGLLASWFNYSDSQSCDSAQCTVTTLERVNALERVNSSSSMLVQ